MEEVVDAAEEAVEEVVDAEGRWRRRWLSRGLLRPFKMSPQAGRSGTLSCFLSEVVKCGENTHVIGGENGSKV